MRTPKPVLERRRSVRIAEKLPFKIGHEDYEAQATTVNISTHGALCWIDIDFPLMTQFRLALSLPGASKTSKRRILDMKGVIVRKDKDPLSGKYLLAIYFSDIKTADRQFLQNYIESRLSVDP